MGLLKGRKQAHILARENLPEKELGFWVFNNGVQYASWRLRSSLPMIKFSEDKGRRVKTMADKQEAYKELSCKDFRSDCDFTIRAKTEEILLERCRKHACSAHDKCGVGRLLLGDFSQL